MLISLFHLSKSYALWTSFLCSDVVIVARIYLLIYLFVIPLSFQDQVSLAFRRLPLLTYTEIEPY